MVVLQSLMVVLAGLGKRNEREAEIDDSDPTAEVDLPEDKIDWRAVRWVAPKTRFGSACYRDPVTNFMPCKPAEMGKTDFHHNEPHPLDEHSWKATSRARRQWARHLRRTWGRMEREAA